MASQYNSDDGVLLQRQRVGLTVQEGPPYPRRGCETRLMKGVGGQHALWRLGDAASLVSIHADIVVLESGASRSVGIENARLGAPAADPHAPSSTFGAPITSKTNLIEPPFLVPGVIGVLVSSLVLLGTGEIRAERVHNCTRVHTCLRVRHAVQRASHAVGDSSGAIPSARSSRPVSTCAHLTPSYHHR